MNVSEYELVILALVGLPKPKHNYQGSMNGRGKLPNWERLWSDLVQEEFRRNIKYGTSSKVEDEEKFSLVGKGNKGKENYTQRKLESSQNNSKQKDLRKSKFFHCHKYRD